MLPPAGMGLNMPSLCPVEGRVVPPPACGRGAVTEMRAINAIRRVWRIEKQEKKGDDR